MFGLKHRFGRRKWPVLCLLTVLVMFGIGYYHDKMFDLTRSGTLTLNQLGYRIAKGKVEFKYLNLKQKSGTPEEVVKRNKKTYDILNNKKISEPKDFDIESIRPPQDLESYNRSSATILCLVRNQDRYQIANSIEDMESHFNRDFQYPYTFINDKPFSENFINHVKKYSKAEMSFVVVSPELWNKPDFIDPQREKEGQDYLVKENVVYARKASYHNMCRFFSGNFYKVPELQNYKYYWRLEPNVKLFTDIKYDVFKYLEGTGKIYGFTMALYDIEQSLPSLWPETLKFLNTDDNYKYINPNGAFQWLVEDLQNPHKSKVAGYSTCHFWSNFEIGMFDFWKSEAYDKYFQHLDSTGNFYYERWGDAPIHALGLSLFADKSKIHWFRDIGYFHEPYQHCPNVDHNNECIPGMFSTFGGDDQNCIANWIDYELGEQINVY